MRLAVILMVLLLSHSAFAQGEAVFQVKRPKQDENKRPVKIDSKLFAGLDTIGTGVMEFDDLTPIIGQYDSVDAVNLKIKQAATLVTIEAPEKHGYASLRFYKKQADGTSRLIFIKALTILTEDELKRAWRNGN